MINVIIPAAGKSDRFNNNKLLEKFGKTIVLTESIRPFIEIDEVEKIILVVSNGDIDFYEGILTAYSFPIHSRIQLCEGGDTRSQSVFNALDFVSDNADIILVHDGARPNVSHELITRVINKVKEGYCVVPTIDIPDTVYAKDLNVEDRNKFLLAQTPQGFPINNFVNAYDEWEKTKPPFSDDFSLVKYYEKNAKFAHVIGDSKNVKITYRSDIKKNLYGIGYDLHNLKESTNKNNKITLCGVQIPFSKEVVAHSDGDVPVHALMDALLSSIGEKDIGHLFPDTDPNYKDISSLILLDKVLNIIKEKGHTIVNVSIIIILEKPKVSSYIDDMQDILSSHLGLDKSCVGITATTNEGSGLIGASEAIAALSMVSVY